MMYAIAVSEIERRVVLVDSPSLTEAIQKVQKAYDEGRIILGAEDVVADPLTGKNARIEHAHWQDVDLFLEEGSEVLK